MDAAAKQDGLTKEHRHTIRKWCLQSVLGLMGYGAVLSFAAGRVNWLWGWIFLGLTGLFLAAHVVLLVPIDPDLLVERAGGLRQSGAKSWDRWLAAFAGGILPMMSWIIAGLDLRFAWSSLKPLVIHLIGVVLAVLGYGLFLWAMVSNAFFSEVVRIQEERGHTVAMGGPYRIIRHPGYAGAIVRCCLDPGGLRSQRSSAAPATCFAQRWRIAPFERSWRGTPIIRSKFTIGSCLGFGRRLVSHVRLDQVSGWGILYAARLRIATYRGEVLQRVYTGGHRGH
jgi:hypothetical protein